MSLQLPCLFYPSIISLSMKEYIQYQEILIPFLLTSGLAFFTSGYNLL